LLQQSENTLEEERLLSEILELFGMIRDFQMPTSLLAWVFCIIYKTTTRIIVFVSLTVP
jgi:hypothetical protein